MKNFVIFLFVSLGFWSCNHEKSTFFSIEGQLADVKDSTKISLYYLIQNNDKWEEISNITYLKNNKFYFDGNINELTAAYLFWDDVNLSIPIYIEPTAIKLVIDKNNLYAYELSGTSAEKENIELRNKLSANMKIDDQISRSLIEIYNQINTHNDEPSLVDSLMKKKDQLKAEYLINAKQIVSIQMDFIKEHNTYQIVPNLLYEISMTELISNDTITAIYNSLPEHSKTTLLGKIVLEQIKQTERALNKKEILVGDTAPDFSRISMQGETIRLTDFRGKSYVLLDFWASWCGPCIKGIPQIKQIYDEYGKKNLKIIGISSDQKEEDWQNAINKHQITVWPQILGNSDNYFRDESDLSEIYNIQYIPEYILIDKQGKVVAKWQHIGEEQLNEIDKILNNKQ